MSKAFKALVIHETEDGRFIRKIQERTTDELPEGEVLIRVKYAALNYKDALSATGHKGITRKYPHTPGVDASGVVEVSADERFQPGDPVIVTSYDLGMNTSGGFSEYIRVPANWVVPQPEVLDAKEAMILGTAGFTAALALSKMEQSGQRPEMGPVVVTGASGGVGSMAVAILARAGYPVIASTGKKGAESYLRSLGAHRVEPRSFTDDTSGRPLLRTSWAGAIDTVGGNTLTTLIKACAKEGCIAACGLVASADLNATVYPFLLNGVNLLGVDSAEYAMEKRLELWDKLAADWKPLDLDSMGTICSLEELNDIYIDKILAGETQGRVVVDLN